MKLIARGTVALIGALAVSQMNYGQNQQSVGTVTGAEQVNSITTAVPFMTIAPDSRHGALGDAGAATSADVYSMYWNPAKMVKNEEDFGMAVSYTPWLRNLVSDISLSHLTGFYKIDDMNAIGVSFRYFTLGDIQFTDEFGNDIQQFRPNEWSIGAGYSRVLSDRLTGGINLKFIYSNLTGGTDVQSAQTKAGLAAATDISVYYENDDLNLNGTDATLAFGAVISNIGNKISYSNLDEQDFLPTNLRLGSRMTLHLDDYNDISVNFDVNKLLVPSPPIYDNGEVIAGMSPDRSVANAMFTSFYDAPGNPYTDSNGEYVTGPDGKAEVEDGSVLREELREIYLGVGAEYWYNKLFAARVGYFTEHELKGNRKFLTFGLGLKYNAIGIDMSYLVPFYVGDQRTITNSPLQNTLRFSLTFNFNNNGGDDSGEPAPINQ